MAKATILVIDDESLMRDYVQEALLRAGHDVSVAASGREGIDALSKKTFDVVVTDLKMQPVDGIEVLRTVRAQSPATACIIMTAYGTVETAVTALKEGAFDYIMKPFTPDELELAVGRALERERIALENRYLREELNRRYDFSAMVGQSEAMQRVYE